MSQRQIILQALKDAGPDRGVHGFEWDAQGIKRYASRIHELKALGYTITSTHEALTPGGAIGARYRLMAEPVVPQVEPLIQDGDDDQVHEQFAMLSELAFTPARTGADVTRGDSRALGYLFDVTKAEVDLQFRAAERYDSKARGAFAVTAGLFTAAQAIAIRSDVVNTLSTSAVWGLFAAALLAATAIGVALAETLRAGKPIPDSVMNPHDIHARVHGLESADDQVAARDAVLAYVALLEKRRQANKTRSEQTTTVYAWCTVAVVLSFLEMMVALGLLLSANT